MGEVSKRVGGLGECMLYCVCGVAGIGRLL